MQKHCPNFGGYLIGQKDKNIIVTRTRCKMWDCPYCAMRNRGIWTAKIIDAINHRDDQWQFMTITAHQRARTTEMSLLNLQGGWRRLVERIRRRHSGTLAYVRVYEPHKDEAMHAHLLTNWLPDDYKHPKHQSDKGSKYLSDAAARCGMGWRTHIIKISGHAGYVVSYITKYMTKNLANLPKGTRRIQCSQGLLLPESHDPSQFDWTIQDEIWLEDMFKWQDAGYEVYDIQRDENMTYDYFDDGFYNPE